MTYIEHEEFAQIEKTCDEVRQENQQLSDYIALLHQEFREIINLNSRGKTKLIADRCNAILNIK
jgi:cell division protein FtsB